MSYEKVQAFFDSKHMGDHVTVHETPCDTVTHAAENIGCEEARIAKTMSFLLDDDHAIVIVSAGDAKVKSKKYKEVFHKKPKMIPWDNVTEIIGHEPGGVCPFALNEGVGVYLDVSLKRFTDVHAAAGRPDATVHLTLEELEETAGSEGWIDVCEGWNLEE